MQLTGRRIHAIRSHWILSLARRLGDLLDEAVPAIVVGEPSDWHSIVQNFEEARRCNSLALERLRSFRDDVGPRGTTDIDPWRVGYDFARRLRRNLRLDGEPLPTMAQLAAVLGEDADKVERVTKHRVDLGDWPTLVDGFVTRDDTGLPAFAFRRRSDGSTARRPSPSRLKASTDTIANSGGSITFIM